MKKRPPVISSKICLWEVFLDLKCNWNYSRKKVCRSEFNKVKVQILR